MNTTFIIKLTLTDEKLADAVEDALLESGYGTVDCNPSDADLVITALMNEDTDDEFIDRMINDEIQRKNKLPVGTATEVIRISDDNAEDWKEFFDLGDYDDDVINAVVADDSSFLRNPECIKGYIDENYIGEFDDESDMARHLADGDPEIQALDDRIVNCMDLTEYYSDEMRYGMWHDGPHWFWNR